ncbi:DUF3221 domain-containing protein [Herpetosiphon giganteus]|uniref:DUF3221 domain-containing protein n=1 Tax=Herpetosiphon giganteus TaxID=2029754 RepID=UPI001957B4F1|nr:DUF3221 domain-containing protein [Herpetosiphon giganteus]MBM7846546.1 hypothetical protein [Herpetosiphon giganteus]
MRYWAILLFILSACGTSSTPKYIGEKPTVKGFIQINNALTSYTTLTLPQSDGTYKQRKVDLIASLHVQDSTDPINQNMIIQVSNETKIFIQNDTDHFDVATAKDLLVGTKITVQCIGQILESYPPLGIADQIIILR